MAKQLTEAEKREALRRTVERAREAEKAAEREREKKVMIEGCTCLRLMTDYAVCVSNRDLVLIISMLRDYVQMIDETLDVTPESLETGRSEGGLNLYLVYYRKRFLELADSLARQIEYDYDAAKAKCEAKRAKAEPDDDVGEDAMVLFSKKGRRDARRRESGGAEPEKRTPPRGKSPAEEPSPEQRMARIEQMWDGDTYVYTLFAGDAVVRRAYRYEECADEAARLGLVLEEPS